MLSRKLACCFLISVMAIGYICTGNILLIISAGFLVLLMLLLYIGLHIFSKNIKLFCIADPVYNAGEPARTKVEIDFSGFRYWGPVEADICFYNKLMDQKTHRRYYLDYADREKQVLELPEEYFNCGSMEMRLEGVRCYDLLGIWSVKRDLNSSAGFMVCPEDFGVHTVIVNMPYAGIMDAENSQNRRGNDNTSVLDMREYQPGDPIRSIHFKMSEKLDRLIVKEYAAPAKYRTLIMIDLNIRYGDTVLEEEELSHVIALASAVSEDLLLQGFGHHMAVIYTGRLYVDEIENSNQLQAFLFKVFGMRASENVELPEAMMRLQLWKDYTRILCFTGMLYDAGVEALAQKTDVAFIKPVREEKGTAEYRNNFEIVTLPVKLLKEHNCRLEI